MRKYPVFKHLALMISLLCVAPFAAAKWTIENGVLLDPNGQPFIFRGVTIDFEVAPDKTAQAIKDAADAGANAVQIELNATYYYPFTIGTKLPGIIKACKDNKVVCVLEPNNVAGWPQSAQIPSPGTTIAFWTDFGIREAIEGQQDYVILGFGNQAFGAMPKEQYISYMEGYESLIREFGPKDFLFIVDGSNWGQDSDKAMQTFAANNKQNNRGKNLIYSVEMFDAYKTPAQIRDYLASFSLIGAPLVIGGFAPEAYYHPRHPGPLPAVITPLPAASAMQYAQQYGAGYFAFNWSGNKNVALNLVSNWDPLNLTEWGKLAFNDVNGIKATAKTATHFFNSSSSSSTVSSSSSSSSSFNPNAPVVILLSNVVYNSCASVDGVAFAEDSVDPEGGPLTFAWEVSDGNHTQQFTGPNIRFPMKQVTFYTVTVTATDSTGLSTSKSTRLYHSYSDNCIGSSSSSSISSRSSFSSTSSSSSVAPKASCTYVINSQWSNGFTGAIRIKNNTAQTLNGWSVNWQYPDTKKVTSIWNAKLGGNNPYTANNDTWNASIQPGQTVEFGFQGNKPAGTAVVPVVTGGVCQ
ncbi:cellulose binding domain-containing protein [Cellvibrio mixtus]|uniref:cellulose binding domain-containing protein n=1 Tax=Cellvibrio mixtus TaxID=39650 RepID=UPI000587F736|nr:cellulose binding domain-containing protein [Cellvibrio mixtus]